MKEKLLKYMEVLTSLSIGDQQSILESLVIKEFSKGTELLRQGDDLSNHCYFVLKGCIRQYFIKDSGKEVTSNFFTEEQAIVISSFADQDFSSKYTLTCLEDSVLVVGDLDEEEVMYKQYPQLETMVRIMLEQFHGQAREEFTSFISSTPEERYRNIIEKRPALVTRVPQHQLASYIGITPESLSRIKNRLNNEIS